MKPFAESCEQNKVPILQVLREEFARASQVLEIGSGTGQHAVYFSAEMPWLRWQPTDRLEHHAGMCAWINEAALPNLAEPLELDVLQAHWPEESYDAVFSANTAHIMGWNAVRAMFAGIGSVLRPGGVFCLYGPFNYHGSYTSESNARFDQWLAQRDPASAIRDFEKLDELAQTHAMQLRSDHAMPANNRTLVWEKR